MKDMKEINTKNIITAYKQYKETVRTADSYRKQKAVLDRLTEY